MQELKLWYNQHRKKIWMTVGVIIALIVVIQLANFLVSRNHEEVASKINSSNQVLSDIRNTTNVDFSSTESAVSGNNVSSGTLKTAGEVIGNFLEYCKQGNITEAYNMLTNECKEEMYRTQEDFQSLYVSEIYDGSEVKYEVQNWAGNIYKIDFSIGDILATGNPNDVKNIQDFITIVAVDDGYKLNINDYIGRTEINKEKDENNVKITVIDKDTYMDYETYTIKVENNSDSDILLSNLNGNANDIYIEDSNGATYSAYTQELTTPDVTINSGDTRTITIRFYSSYVSTKNIDRLVFSNVIINYDSTTGLTAGKETRKIAVNI